jgi:hypothetical protein
MRLITLGSITYTVPVPGAEKVEIKHNGRKVLIDAVDHVRVNANVVHSFPKLIGEQLLTERLVRRVDPVLDDEADAGDDEFDVADAALAVDNQTAIDAAVSAAVDDALALAELALAEAKTKAYADLEKVRADAAADASIAQELAVKAAVKAALDAAAVETAKAVEDAKAAEAAKHVKKTATAKPDPMA